MTATMPEINAIAARAFRGPDVTLSTAAERLGLPISAPPKPAPAVKPREEPPTRTRRPDDLIEMVGQDHARVTLKVRVQGARMRQEHPGHVLLFGPPGLGKTTLAEIVARETGGELVRAVGSQLATPEVLARTLGDLRRDHVDILFVDEIHALPKKIEELLYLAMEDGRVEITTGRGADARIQSITLPPFILVGATTLPGWLSQPFRDRFATKLSLEYYTDEQLTTIIAGYAAKKGAQITSEAAASLGRRSRGTPRVALSLFTAAWDYALVMSGSPEAAITEGLVDQALELEGVDAIGLTKDDRVVLQALCAHRGQPIGIENLSASIGLDRTTITGTIEPFLLRAGLMMRHRRGRKATRAAFEYLGLEVPATVDDTATHADAAWEDRD